MLTILIEHARPDMSKLLIFIPYRLRYNDVPDECETKPQTLVAINTGFPAAATLYSLWPGVWLNLSV